MEFLLFIFLVPLIWLLICNQLTWKERDRVISQWHIYDDLFMREIVEFDRVDYNKHLWYKLTFRNTKQLYGPLTQAIWK